MFHIRKVSTQCNIEKYTTKEEDHSGCLIAYALV